MNDTKPIILWFRRDLRLSDHAALTAACETGRPVIPVFIHDGLVERLGAAPKWRLGLGLEVLAQTLATKDSRLILRREGRALKALKDLVAQTGATMADAQYVKGVRFYPGWRARAVSRLPIVRRSACLPF